jgi:uncharacterized protein YciI
MKQFILLISLIIVTHFVSFAQQGKTEPNPEDQIRQYWFVMIKTGPNQTLDSLKRKEAFKGHMANMTRLYNEGILKVAGPFGKNDFNWEGIFVYDCKTKEDAEKIVQTDPAVSAGLLVVDIVPWYTSPIDSFKPGKPTKAGN